MFIVTMLCVAVITVALSLFAFEAVRWEERMTTVEESVLSQLLMERRQRREGRDQEQLAS